MSNHNISEEAGWFLKKMQGLQDNFASAVGGQIVMTDEDGNLITEMSGAQEVCQMIKDTEKGAEKCQESYDNALSLVKEKEEPIFMDCWAGFASLWVPIKIEGKVVGSITGCGGRYDKGETREELVERYSEVAEDLGIEENDEFIRAAIDEISPVTKEEMERRAGRLAKLIGILAEQTSLSEAFEV